MILKIAGGVLAGLIVFAAGYLAGSRRHGTSSPAPRERDPRSSAVAMTDIESAPAQSAPTATRAGSPGQASAVAAAELAVLRDKLRSAEVRLAQTGAQLEAAGQANGQYDRLMETVRLKMESNQGRRPAIWPLAFDERTFQPRSDLVTFLGLDEERARVLRDLCRQNLQRVQDWELQHSRVVSQSDTKLSYLIPRLPDQLKAAFVEDLASVIDPDYMEFVVMNAVDPLFYSGREPDQNKVITYSILDKNNRLWYQIATAFADKDGTNKYQDYSTSSPSSTVPTRWNHFFDVE